MRSPSEIEEYLEQNTGVAIDDFNREMSTDENRDYRRGFRAGVLFAYLDTRSFVGKFHNVNNEESST